MLKHAMKHEKISYTSTKPNIEYDLLCFFLTLNYITESDVIGFIKNLTMNGKIIGNKNEIKKRYGKTYSYKGFF